MDRRHRLRGRDRRYQSPARSGLHPVGHLLRLEAPGDGWGRTRRGSCFIVPGLVLILALSAVFLAGHPAHLGAGRRRRCRGGGALPALHAATGLVPASRRRMGTKQGQKLERWVGLCPGGRGLCRHRRALSRAGGPRVLWGVRDRRPPEASANESLCPYGLSLPERWSTWLPPVVSSGLAWVALEVGALSYGGGFVIIPLMQDDAVTTYTG